MTSVIPARIRIEASSFCQLKCPSCPTNARDMLHGRAPAREDIPCTTCEIYRSKRERGSFMTREGG